MKHDQAKIKEIGDKVVVLGAKNEWWNGKYSDITLADIDGFEDSMKKYAEDINQQEKIKLVNYLKKQVEIHSHFLEDYDQAPFEWHRGRRDEALDLIEKLK